MTRQYLFHMCKNEWISTPFDGILQIDLRGKPFRIVRDANSHFDALPYLDKKERSRIYGLLDAYQKRGEIPSTLAINAP